MPQHEDVRRAALQFLKDTRVASVATASRSGEPQVSAVYYLVEEDFTLYFLTTSQSRKIKNLRENPHLAFTMWHDRNPITVQGGGSVELIEQNVQQFFMMLSDKLKTTESYHWPILKIPHADLIVIKVRPTWLTWLNLDMDHPETYQEDYYQILP